jgi:hypothetical protein
MNIERGRSNPGFQELPSVASSLGNLQPPTQLPETSTASPTDSTVGTQQQLPPVPPTQQQVIPERPTTRIPTRPHFQQPRFTPPGFMAWPRMPAPFNPWAGRIGPPQHQPQLNATAGAQQQAQDLPQPQLHQIAQQPIQHEPVTHNHPQMQQPLQNPGEWNYDDNQLGAEQPPPHQQHDQMHPAQIQHQVIQQKQPVPAAGGLTPSDIAAIRDLFRISRVYQIRSLQPPL